jgi:Xaa-Pro aminopeptidase
MARDGIDALVVAARGDEFMRGRLQYVSDVHMWAGRAFVVLPADAPPIFFGEPLWGIGRATLPGWVTDARLSAQPGDSIGHALRDLGLNHTRIGIVGLEDVIAVRDLRQIATALPDAELVDGTALFDAVRAIKSEEEISHLRETSAILKRAYQAIEAHLAPGQTDRQVVAEAHRLCRLFGCLDGIAILGRRPFRSFAPPTGAVFHEDDIIGMDLEWGGPAHYWLELRRVYSFRPPPDDARRFWEMRVEAQHRCAAAMKPGVSSDEILTAMNAVYRKYGYDAEGQISYAAHGIGTDSLEPPWVPGKEVILQAGMVLSLHPHIRFADPAAAAALGGIGLADNVLVTASGGERLTDQTDQWIVV